MFVFAGNAIPVRPIIGNLSDRAFSRRPVLILSLLAIPASTTDHRPRSDHRVAFHRAVSCPTTQSASYVAANAYIADVTAT